MELLPSFLRARLSAAVAISFSSPVSRCCFRAHLHFVQSAAWPSQDIVSMSTAFMFLTKTSWYRRWGRPVVLFPMPAHRRGCLLECDHPPYGGHDQPSQMVLHYLQMVDRKQGGLVQFWSVCLWNIVSIGYLSFWCSPFEMLYGGTSFKVHGGSQNTAIFWQKIARANSWLIRLNTVLA